MEPQPGTVMTEEPEAQPKVGELIRGTECGSESTEFINLIPPTVVAWLLQYSGSRVEHRDGFSSHK